MINKKIEVLKLIDKANNSNYLEDFESLKKQGYEAGFLRAMKEEGLIFWGGANEFHLTKEGEKILREERLIESVKINEAFIGSITEQATRMQKALASSLFNVQNMSSVIAQAIPKIDYSKLIPDYSKMFKGLFSALENLNLESAKKFQDKFPWLDFLSIGLALKLGDLLEKESEKKVFEELFKISCEKDFEDYLNESFSKIPFLTKRLKIILEGYNQHKGKNFISSVSILAPQIEGIIWDIGVFEKVVKDEKNSKEVIDCKGKVIRKVNGIYKDIKWDLNHLILHIFGNEDPQTEYYSKILYSELRNPLAHGRETDFDKIENSVTCLLLIMAMIEKIKDLQKENEQTKK